MNSIAWVKNSIFDAAARFPATGHARIRLRTGISVVLAIAIGFCATANAQIVYTPEHPDVKAIADRAVAKLNQTKGGLDRKTLAALAIVEHGKRYQQKVPKDNPVVKAAIEGLIKGIPLDGDGEGGILNQSEMYFPCLALILLAETDAAQYKPQIKALIRMLEKRQLPNGSYSYREQPKTSDTSQTQFAALAMYVAKHHGFDLDPQMGKRTLQWIVASQLPTGSWIYKLATSGAPNDPGRAQNVSTPSLSMHAAGCGTAYLLADFLHLNKRVKKMNVLAGKDIGLPKTVSIYVKPIDGENQLQDKAGPLVQFDRARLANATRGGNAWLEKNFAVDPNNWKFYYFYAMERYAYFREQAEGDVGNGRLANWYDQIVEHIKALEEKDGLIKGTTRESPDIANAFAVLVLVRSSEVINSPVSDSELAGGIGFETDAVLNQTNGQLRAIGAEKDLSELLSLMKEDASQAQLEQLSNSLKKQILEFRQKDDKSRGEIKAFLQSMISARSYFRRLIAVRFLAGEQDMDNVPALIYALGDPDLRICLEAHDGLRLVSRKIDSMTVSQNTRANAKRYGVLEEDEESLCRIEFDSMKQRWTDWFLKIRPDAELLE